MRAFFIALSIYLCSATSLWFDTRKIHPQPTDDPKYDCVQIVCSGGSGSYEYHFRQVSTRFRIEKNVIYVPNGYFREENRIELYAEVVDIKTSKRIYRKLIFESYHGVFQVFERKVTRRSNDDDTSDSSDTSDTSTTERKKDSGDDGSSDSSRKHKHRRNDDDSSDSSSNKKRRNDDDSSSKKKRRTNNDESSDSSNKKKHRRNDDDSSDSSSNKKKHRRSDDDSSDSSSNKKRRRNNEDNTSDSSNRKRGRNDDSSKTSKKNRRRDEEDTSQTSIKKRDEKRKTENSLTTISTIVQKTSIFEYSQEQLEIYIEEGNIRQLNSIFSLTVQETSIDCVSKANFLTGFVGSIERYLGYISYQIQTLSTEIIEIQKSVEFISGNQRSQYQESLYRKQTRVQQLQVIQIRLKDSFPGFIKQYDVEYYKCHGVQVQETFVSQESITSRIEETQLQKYVKEQYHLERNLRTSFSSQYVEVRDVNFYSAEWAQEYKAYNYYNDYYYEDLHCSYGDYYQKGIIQRIERNSIYVRYEESSIEHRLTLGCCSRLEVVTGKNLPEIGDTILFKGSYSKYSSEIKVHSALCY